MPIQNSPWGSISTCGVTTQLEDVYMHQFLLKLVENYGVSVLKVNLSTYKVLSCEIEMKVNMSLTCPNTNFCVKFCKQVIRNVATAADKMKAH